MSDFDQRNLGVRDIISDCHRQRPQHVTCALHGQCALVLLSGMLKPLSQLLQTYAARSSVLQLHSRAVIPRAVAIDHPFLLHIVVSMNAVDGHSLSPFISGPVYLCYFLVAEEVLYTRSMQQL